MAKLPRYLMQLFASTAGANEISEFGAAAAGGFIGTPAAFSGATVTPDDVQGLANYLEGWFGAVDGEFNPAIEDMNAVHWLFSYMLAYIMQAGVPEWDTGTTYFIGSLAQDGSGNVYVSITNSNTGNALTSTANWKNLSTLEGVTSYTNAGSPYTMTGAEQTIEVDATSGNVAITLPDRATYKGKSFNFDRIDASTNTVTITRAGSDTFADINTTSYDLDTYQSQSVFAGSTKWKIRG